MKDISETIRLNKKIRVIGFDDSPFSKADDVKVNISGIVCSNTRFEGMVWGEIEKDGIDATDSLISLISTHKFYDQLHAVLIDGLAFGGFNLIDLPLLAEEVSLPCIAVMRKMPDLQAIDNALQNFSDYETRKHLIESAGEIFHHEPFFYQCAGIDSNNAGLLLERVTDQGKVPEALRLSHLIGSAIKTGVSSKRA